MASDAPERIWATMNGMSTRFPDMKRQWIGGWSEDKDRPHAVEYVRSDLNAPVLPPPGSEAEAAMVERMARVIAYELRGTPDRDATPEELWSDCTESSREVYKNMARAALRAIAQPKEGA